MVLPAALEFTATCEAEEIAGQRIRSTLICNACQAYFAQMKLCISGSQIKLFKAVAYCSSFSNTDFRKVSTWPLSLSCAVPVPSAETLHSYSSGSFAEANSAMMISPVTCMLHRAAYRVTQQVLRVAKPYDRFRTSSELLSLMSGHTTCAQKALTARSS